MENNQPEPPIISNQPEPASPSEGNSLEQPAQEQSLNQPVIAINEPIDPRVSVMPGQPYNSKKLLKRAAIGLLIVLMLLGGGYAMLRGGKPVATKLKIGSFDTQQTSLTDIPKKPDTESNQLVTVNGGLQIARSLILSPSIQPSIGVTGGLYFDQATSTLNYYNGTKYVSLTDATGTNVTINNSTIIQGGSASSGNALNGTPGQLVKFTGPTEVGNSIVSENGLTVDVGGNLNLVSTVTTPMNEFFGLNPDTVPTSLNVSDESQPLELGVKFRTDVSGFVRGVRFYKGSSNTGVHTGTLWTSSGAQLATGVFTNETATGWQEMRFATPIAISADTTYIVSYHSSSSFYSATPEFFLSGGVDKESLHILRDGDDGGNGVYNYSVSTVFPTRSSRGSNYFVDVVFLPNPPPNRYRINGVQIASADLANNTDIAKRSASQIFTGNNTFRPSVNTANTFSIQAASGTVLFSASASEGRIYIGSATPSAFPIVLVLSNKDTTGDPAGTEGAIYYNSALRSFRCYRSGAWDNCAQPEVDHSFAVYEEFLGGQNTSFVTNSFGSLGWQAVAIGANGTVSYDPGVPTPSADRPGILALQTPAVVNQGTTFYLGGTSGTLIPAKDNIVKTALAVGATSQVVRIGIHSETTGTTRPLFGIWWEADTAVHSNWQYCWGSGVAATCQPSGVAITADAWVRLELRITATGSGTSSLEALANGNFYQQSATTIDSAARLSPAFSCFGTTGAAGNCYWDYYQLKGTSASGR